MACALPAAHEAHLPRCRASTFISCSRNVMPFMLHPRASGMHLKTPAM